MRTSEQTGRAAYRAAALCGDGVVVVHGPETDRETARRAAAAMLTAIGREEAECGVDGADGSIEAWEPRPDAEAMAEADDSIEAHGAEGWQPGDADIPAGALARVVDVAWPVALDGCAALVVRVR